MTSINEIIRKSKAKVERRAYIKRMQQGSGEFESDWLEITKDVKKWGTISTKADDVKINQYRLISNKIVVANELGKYNDTEHQDSLWYGYVGQQRTLVKLNAMLVSETYSSSKIWTKTRFPAEALWDTDYYDEVQWDERGANFIGLISGDPYLSDKNEVIFNLQPLTQVFKDFPANRLDFYTSTGLTASEFIEGIRDFTDAGGNYVFRPFFDNATSNWSITSTTHVYEDLNTSTADAVADASVWEVIEKLAQAENFAPLIKKNGVFYFGSKNPNTTQSFEFYGAGIFNSEYGHTIKKINRYGKRQSKFYNRIRVKYLTEDTTSSYIEKASDFSISSSNLPWRLGYRTLEIDNSWIGNTATADTIAQEIFNEVSAYKNEIEFQTVFIPHLEVLDLVSLSYDASKKYSDELWDANNWDTQLTWAREGSQGLRFSSKEFKILSMEIDLDRLTTKFVARES